MTNSDSRLHDIRDERIIKKFFKRHKIHGLGTDGSPEGNAKVTEWYITDGPWSDHNFVRGPFATSHDATVGRLLFLLHTLKEPQRDERNKALINDFIKRYTIVGRRKDQRFTWYIWDRENPTNRFVSGPYEDTELAAIARIKFLLKIIRESNQ